MEVTKDMLIGEILKKDQTIAAILMASGMPVSYTHLTLPTIA